MAKLSMNPATLTAEQIVDSKVALAFLASIGKDFTREEIVIRYARRELALAKDKARKANGEGARVYLPANVDALAPKVRKALAPVVEIVSATREHAAPEPKPAPKATAKPAPRATARKVRKAADSAAATIAANEKRIAEIEAALAARKATAKAPTVRKAAAVKVSAKGL